MRLPTFQELNMQAASPERDKTPRPPTSQEKEYLKKDLHSLRLFKHFAGLILKDELREIHFSELATFAVDDQLTQNKLTCSEWNVLSRLSDKLSAQESYDLWKAIGHLQPVLFNGTRVRVDASLPNYAVKYFRVLEDGNVSSHGINGTNHDLMDECVVYPALFIDLLVLGLCYVIDQETLLTEERGKGQGLDRLIRIYPSRRLNALLLNRFKGQLDILRFMELEGHEIEKVTREQMRSFAEGMAKSRESESNAD